MNKHATVALIGVLPLLVGCASSVKRSEMTNRFNEAANDAAALSAGLPPSKLPVSVEALEAGRVSPAVIAQLDEEYEAAGDSEEDREKYIAEFFLVKKHVLSAGSSPDLADEAMALCAGVRPSELPSNQAVVKAGKLSEVDLAKLDREHGVLVHSIDSKEGTPEQQSAQRQALIKLAMAHSIPPMSGGEQLAIAFAQGMVIGAAQANSPANRQAEALERSADAHERMASQMQFDSL